MYVQRGPRLFPKRTLPFVVSKRRERFGENDKLFSGQEQRKSVHYSSYERKSYRRSVLGMLLFVTTSLFFLSRFRKSSGKKEEEEEAQTFSESTVRGLKSIPTRYLSSLWGTFTAINFPAPVQTGLNNLYAYLTGCILDEAEKPITAYPSLSAFFQRHLKDGTRPIDETAQLICPVDGRLVEYGNIIDEHTQLTQVKGVTFSLRDFMGKDSIIFDLLSQRKALEAKGVSPTSQLYYCVIYLAPGDYHGYHSPAQWTVEERVHFPGHLFPVASWAVKTVKELFAMNERVVLNGRWKHGFFSYSPVGAYNVGSISLAWEKDFRTNLVNQSATSAPEHKIYSSSIPVEKGENVGFFNLGSSLVLIWEAPKSVFVVDRGSKIKLGEPLTKTEE